ncbi:DUF4232 domain-containing protein [Saccharopolyspora rhizosphaerae]|uniref:DUF4232 domain-containing protein n=1 Tax=Saccharopolyspora rhizosphaerae TaxID=2492662 RepID=A0A3R8P7R8_9PSEU|nr:DUF4232 domain-containing protein [Saccharopolyspora rhizosphaerae]RRO18193.1 DUF4232 domain-containing protein [Saccharopolyspora rhizosphaerae]
MTRTKIILAATAALLTAGLSACEQEGTNAASTVVADQPTTSVHPPVEAPPAETAVAPPSEAATSEHRTTSPEQPEPPSTPLCDTGDLTPAVEYVDSAAGTAHLALRFTNSGDRTCEIQGFPGVSFVGGDDGHQIGRPAGRVGGKGPAITLAPGGQAWAPLASPRAENYDPATCRPEEARGLRVYPPQEYDSLFVPHAETACANPDLPGEQLTVKTIQEGSPS